MKSTNTFDAGVLVLGGYSAILIHGYRKAVGVSLHLLFRKI